MPITRINEFQAKPDKAAALREFLRSVIWPHHRRPGVSFVRAAGPARRSHSAGDHRSVGQRGSASSVCLPDSARSAAAGADAVRRAGARRLLWAVGEGNWWDSCL